MFVLDLRAILTYHFENVSVEFSAALAICFWWTLTFCLLVEEPFVYFDPFQSCCLHGFLSGFSIHVAVVLIVDALEDEKLISSLVLAKRKSGFLPALIIPHFTLPFTRNGRPSF